MGIYTMEAIIDDFQTPISKDMTSLERLALIRALLEIEKMQIELMREVLATSSVSS
jgi:hypothetical protein